MDLPKEVWLEILLKLPYDKIIEKYRINKRTNNISYRIYFLQYYISMNNKNFIYKMKNEKSHALISVLIMIFASIIIGYYLTMTILLRRNISNDRNRAYQALLMGFWMGFVELLMISVMTEWLPSYNIVFVILIFGIILFTYLIYNQIAINENQFMLSMISHHEMALEMAKQVKPKLTNKQLEKIVDDILLSQQQQIDEMYCILQKNNVPNNITSLFY